MFQNRSSSTESAHAKVEASVSENRLESGGKSLEQISKGKGIRLRYNLELSEYFRWEAIGNWQRHYLKMSESIFDERHLEFDKDII